MLYRQYEAFQLPVQQALWSSKLPSKTFDPPCGGSEWIEDASSRHAPSSSFQNQYTTGRFYNMELFSAPWWSALLAIILIDLVLAGDNAIVIALAARNLPPNLQKKAILWGTVGAIAVRTAMTLIVVWLLKIPGLMLIGGLGLVWIAYKLLVDTGGDDHDGPAATTFWGAMKTIVIADALMGIDNVLGVAGAANGNMTLVVLGLLISVPIVVYGSQLVLKLVERFPIIIQLGAAVLAFTAAKMIVSEKLLAGVFNPPTSYADLARWSVYVICIAGVLGGGWWAAKRAAAQTKPVAPQ